MKRLILAGAALAVLVAVPTIAQQAPRGDASRADVEAGTRTMFERVDANRDGYVTQEEGKQVRAAHRTERRAAVFARLDADRDGAISRAEFDAPRARTGDRAERRENRMERRQERRQMRMSRMGGKRFERMDANKDGRVSLAEATAVRLQRFDRADANRDGTVSRDERRTLREAMRAQRAG